MSTDTERLEREAEARRSSLNETIEELRNRMSPGQILDEAVDYFGKGQANAAMQNLGRQVRDNPLALGLVGAGLAWLVLGNGARTASPHGGSASSDSHPAYDESLGSESGIASSMAAGSDKGRSPGLGDRLADAASSATGAMSNAASSLASGASAAASRVGSTASGAGAHLRQAHEATSSGIHSIGGGAYRTGAQMRRGLLDTLQDEPLVFGAIALAVGAAIGASLPSTSIEDEYLGDAGDRLRDQARDYGTQAFETVKDVASETYQAASQEAEKQGLMPKGDGDTLASKISNVVGAAGEAVRDHRTNG
ncbi:hypothetical protein GCM10011390_04690 [Aureimonas endophytica]|uniref:DUF3618 domain-containing protein n=1 Tax=Aureimonas endophytica TaxID=2027858 RepID=A0A916ZCT5_9HYPH|nr:DUF3618 domain-containing protein [Aureimonas endophytica]GGD89000.1 hypothetical protein GCM10011390_04690 [Aureimonas endophytica]